MPRFYFDIHDGSSFVEDHTGTEYDSLDAAERVAVKSAAELARERVPNRGPHTITVAVRDAQRRPVLTLTLSIQVKRVEARDFR